MMDTLKSGRLSVLSQRAISFFSDVCDPQSFPLIRTWRKAKTRCAHMGAYAQGANGSKGVPTRHLQYTLGSRIQTCCPLSSLIFSLCSPYTHSLPHFSCVTALTMAGHLGHRLATFGGCLPPSSSRLLLSTLVAPLQFSLCLFRLSPFYSFFFKEEYNLHGSQPKGKKSTVNVSHRL